jgi:hypothetical protein
MVTYILYPEAFEELIIKLIDNEIAMSRLYRQYAVSFPEDASLWNGLCYQELLHAESIMQLNQWIREGKISKGMTSLTQSAVTASIDFINSVRIRCEQGDLSQVKAYALEFDIENSLIEKRFFSVFALEKPEVLEIMVL